VEQALWVALVDVERIDHIQIDMSFNHFGLSATETEDLRFSVLSVKLMIA